MYVCIDMEKVKVFWDRIAVPARATKRAVGRECSSVGAPGLHLSGSTVPRLLLEMKNCALNN